MRAEVLLVVLLVAPGAAIAQDEPIPRKAVTTQKVIRSSESNQFYEVDATGTVWVDWRAVETIAADPQRSDNLIAQTMLAIRDGKVKDFSQRR